MSTKNSATIRIQLETLDFAVVPGEFGVAENGAIWLWDTAIRNRVLLFITQHLVLVISREPNRADCTMPMSDCRSARARRVHRRPLETADIEQSLVISTSGRGSLTVYCVK